jgi:hypothetical protein
MGQSTNHPIGDGPIYLGKTIFVKKSRFESLGIQNVILPLLSE